MNRISVTTLESFRRYVEEVSSWDTEEKFIESLSGEFKGNDKTEFGTAYHSLIEGDWKTYDKNDDSLEVGDFIFSWDQAEPGLLYKKAHLNMVHEMVVSKTFETKRGPIQVSGRVDGIEGISIRDIKTKFRAPKDQEYIDSLQWKAYLIMMELDIFYYDIFEVKRFDTLPIQKPYTFPEVMIMPPIEIECLRYDRMEQDFQYYLDLFMDYIYVKNFNHFLKPAKEHEDFIF